MGSYLGTPVPRLGRWPAGTGLTDLVSTNSIKRKVLWSRFLRAPLSTWQLNRVNENILALCPRRFLRWPRREPGGAGVERGSLDL